MITKNDVFGNEYCILVDKTKDIASDKFNVVIPRLMPKIIKGDISSPKVSSKNLNSERFVNTKAKIKSSVKLANYIEAKSATSIRASHVGDAKMDKSKGITETETVKKAPVKLSHSPKGGPPHPPHEHIIKQPFEFYGMEYFKLNSKKIKNGKQMLGVFIGNNYSDFWVTYIPDVIPRRG